MDAICASLGACAMAPVAASNSDAAITKAAFLMIRLLGFEYSHPIGCNRGRRRSRTSGNPYSLPGQVAQPIQNARDNAIAPLTGEAEHVQCRGVEIAR